MRSWCALFYDESGSNLIEYALISAIVCICAISALLMFGGAADRVLRGVAAFGK